MKKYILSFLVAFMAFSAYSQVTPDNATNVGQWPDGVVIAWICPKTGPVVSIPFTIYALDGTPYSGSLTCGVDDGTKYEKPKSPTEKDI